MTNPKEGGTTISSESKSPVTSNARPTENQLRYLWNNLFKLRKEKQFLIRENAYLRAIMSVVYEPEKLTLALAKYQEWKETQVIKL